LGVPVALRQQGGQIGWIDGPGCLALGEGPIAQGDQVGLQLFLLVRVQGLYRPCWWGIKDVNCCHALTATRVALASYRKNAKMVTATTCPVRIWGQIYS
jgi:hypothetical protein